MIPAWQTPHLQTGDFNGLGQIGSEYRTPGIAWAKTYDADFDGEYFRGNGECPHCKYISNHYNGIDESPEWDCGQCGHRSVA